MKSPEEAYLLLEKLGAPRRLLLHVRLVGEAADRLIEAYGSLGIDFDRELIRVGVAVHDAGKILYPEELDGTGSQHEEAGQLLMIKNGVPARIARCCVSHANWEDDTASFEERSVALADKLWKGKRVQNLELLVIDEAAAKLQVDRWNVFEELDNVFEEIAAGGDGRLARSQPQ